MLSGSAASQTGSSRSAAARASIVRHRWLALVVAGCAVAGCALAPSYQRPVLSVVSVELAGGNLLQQNLLVTFDIQNPNRRALPVTGLHAEVTVDGQRLASGVSNRPFVVPAQGSTQFDMNISANLGVLLLKLGQHGDGNANGIDYDMTGAASVDLPFLHELAFHQHGSFPLHTSP